MYRGSAQEAGTRKVHVMPRILGLDHGERRTGVAVSDPLGVTAQPVEEIVVSSAEELIDRVSALVQEYDAARVVVGHPRNMDGSVGARARSVEAFASRLATAIQPVPVELVDERLSTWEPRSGSGPESSSSGKKNRAEPDGRTGDPAVLPGPAHRDRSESCRNQRNTKYAKKHERREREPEQVGTERLVVFAQEAPSMRNSVVRETGTTS